MKKTVSVAGNTLIPILGIVLVLAGCKRDLDSAANEKNKTAAAGSYTVLTTQRPTTTDSDTPVELGMKFKSAVSGDITKFRYFKPAGETGTHTGRLWSAGGVLLKSVVFTNETDTGWQTVALDTPYHIAKDSIYVISVNAVTRYAATPNELRVAIVNGPLSNIAGNNGVYTYKSGTFPVSSYSNTNYYRDIEFVAADNDANAPTAPGNLTASNITNNSVSLAWSASTDDVWVTGYEVYSNGSLLTTVTTTSFSVSGLNQGTAYSFYIKATDAFGNRSASSNMVNVTTLGTAGITHGMQLTTSLVGPAGISITSLTTVPGGTFTGAALSGWGNLARAVGAGGETIDGFTFPAGTVVLQGANVSSRITVSSGWLVLRGCKGAILANHPSGNGGGAAALYCELTEFNTVGRKDGDQPAAAIVHRCYFPHSGLENVYSDNVTVTECWIAPDPAAAGSGDHIDGIQTWGGQYYLNFSRNHIEFNAPYTAAGGFSGMIGMYSDGAQNGFSGYDHVTITNNYFILHGYGIALHAPLAVPVTNMAVTGNRWKWSTDAEDKDYTNAVYHNPSQSIPNYKADGNSWRDNRWADGPYKDSFLLPDNQTSGMEY
ncbi:hypothetical protein A4D02_35215 [Niastella koreensis]|uniref:Fibronectin type III domain protein n=2 Tax=Niastella koreensis TaxID=354356 RepID=G8TBR6_NIAKG|nr:DUF4082 domain-containing protein [Niastella koreensis]AEV98198.1 Fibronectin type III domain protein [Niastella koreensis GR20-10]OQP44308.1 hypothetical protein A4D02_35215 [Niastella koreensis]